MTKKECFKDCLKYPKDTIFLSLFNFAFSLICFKNLLAFFQSTSLESWGLLAISLLGMGVSLSIFKFKKWSFALFHIFSGATVLTALANLFFTTNQTSFFMFLATIAYGAVGSLILHRYTSSACFNPKEFISRRIPVKLKAFLNVNENQQAVEVLDISNTGCFLQTELDLKLGDKHQLCIKFEDYSLMACCKIMKESSFPKGYGMMFTGIDQRQYSSSDLAIQALYQKLAAKHHGHENHGISA